MRSFTQIEQFGYLRRLINADDGNGKDIQRRIGYTTQTFGKDMEKQQMNKENEDKNI